MDPTRGEVHVTVDQHEDASQYRILSPEAYDDGATFWKRLRHDHPVYFDPEARMWVITRYDDVKTVVQSPTIFGKQSVGPLCELVPEAREVLHDYLTEYVPTFDANPPEHAFYKRIVRAPLSGPKVAKRREIIHEIAEDLVDEFADDGKADIISQFAFLLPAIHTYRYMGVPTDELDDIRQEGVSQVTLWNGFPPPEEQPALARDAANYWKRLKWLVDDHVANPRDDIIGDLLAEESEDGRKLNRLEIVAILRGLVVGAHRTSTNLIGNTLYALLSVRERWERVVADPTLAEAAVNESLRADSPAVGLPYVAFEDTELGGEHIKKGDVIYPSYRAANRDENEFEDPDRWDMDRLDNTRNMAFGGGIHLCPGTALGRLTGATAIAVLAERLPSMQLVDDHPRHLPTFASNGYEQLLVSWG
jgi:cytochrome P450